MSKRFENFKKRMNMIDIAFIKLSVLFFVLWIVGLLPSSVDSLMRWRWLFFVLFVVFSIRPLKKFFSKENLEVKKIEVNPVKVKLKSKKKK